MRSRSPARFLAPLALLVAVLAVYVVVSSTIELGGDDSSPATSTSSREERETATTSTTSRERRERERASRRTYTVQSGDTLGTIAEAQGVTIDRLQELNPDVDPQSLRVGQRIRLPE